MKRKKNPVISAAECLMAFPPYSVLDQLVRDYIAWNSICCNKKNINEEELKEKCEEVKDLWDC